MDLKAWPDNSVGRVLDVHSHGSQVRITLKLVILLHFNFSFLLNPVVFAYIDKIIKLLEVFQEFYVQNIGNMNSF